MKKIHSAIKNNKVLLKYLSSTFINIPITLITGFFSLRLIDPLLMGIWSTVLIFETYSTFLRLGIINGMNRELPFELGSGNKSKAIGYAQTTLHYTLVDIGIVLIIAPLLIPWATISQEYLLSILVIIIKICIKFYSSYLMGTFRSNNDFNKLSNVNIYSSLVRLLSAPIIIFGFEGFLIYQLLYVLVESLLLHYWRPIKVKPVFYKEKFFHLMKIGLPINLTTYLGSAIETLPKLYIINFGNEIMLGLYAPTMMMLGIFRMLPTSITTYIYPKFSFRIGAKEDPWKILHSLLKIYGVCFVIISFLALIVFFVLDYFVILFPKYQESLPYLKLSLLFAPFIYYRLPNMINVALKSYRGMIYYLIIYCIIQVSSLAIFNLLLTDILDIAIYSQIATAILLLIFGTLLNAHIIRCFNKNNSNVQ